MTGFPDLHVVVMDKNVDHGGSPAGDHETIEADALEFEREVARGEGVGNKAGKRGFSDHGELGRRGETGADQRRAGEDQRVGWGKRIDSRRRVVVEQARAEADAAEECAEARLLQIFPGSLSTI